MAFKKTLSLVLIFFSLTFIPSKANAFSIYAGPSYSFGGVIAESDFYNGATDWAPGFMTGMKYGRLSMELFLRKFALKRDTEKGGVSYEMEIDNVVTGMSFRIEVHPILDLIMGVNGQNVLVRANSKNSSNQLSGLLDKSYVNWHVGGGLKGEIYPNVISRVDLVYYKGDIDFGLFGIDFSLMYNFVTF